MKGTVIALCVAGMALSACVTPEEPDPAVARLGQQDFSEAFALYDSICLRAGREGGLAKAKSLAAARGFKKSKNASYIVHGKGHGYYTKPGSRQNLVIGKFKNKSARCGVEWTAENNVAIVSSQAFFRKMHSIQGREELGFFDGTNTQITLGETSFSWSQSYNAREKSQLILLTD
ncbi:hypothetical protein [Leisingera sp. NJS204]|uniref:hypothetical protein n=1 Tax=Leisingera sp. NJS204 TaxID=2508307 RepID=UPI001012E5A8|nr:hypothetical protein [Leisingera sp. NJS204]QAX28624.1 hypothetical protein ETW24_04095 [Leisingera sp. NJS204]